MTRHSYELPEQFDRWSVIEKTHVDGAVILPDEAVCDRCHLVAYKPVMHVHHISGHIEHWCGDCDDAWREKVRQSFKPPRESHRMGASSGEPRSPGQGDRDGASGAHSGEPQTGGADAFRSGA